jgi:hypothetical protein
LPVLGDRLLNFETLFGTELGPRCTPLPKGTGAFLLCCSSRRQPSVWRHVGLGPLRPAPLILSAAISEQARLLSQRHDAGQAGA